MDATLSPTSTAAVPTESSGASTSVGIPAAPEIATGAPAFVPEAPKSPAQKALERAKSRIAGIPPAQTDFPPESQEQAAAPGASTPETQAEKPAAQDETGTSATPEAPASTPTAPQHWDAQLKEAFDGIPTEAGKAAMLKVYQSMQAPFTQGMQSLRAREQQLDGLVQLKSAFEQDPKAALEQLANTVGVQVWFEPPAAPGEVPEFQSPAELAEWAKQQALAELKNSTQSELAQFRAEQAKERAAIEFRAELEAAAGKYADFRDHQPGILDTLRAFPELPVERAYQLATWGNLAKRAAEGETALKELTTLKEQLKAKAANAMRPTAGQVGEVKPNGEEKLTQTERAFARAQRRVAATHAS